MAYFRYSIGGGGGGAGATITITYDEGFYGETITCSHGSKSYSKTATSSGSVIFNVDEEGLWLISSEIEGATYTLTVDIDLSGEGTLVSAPEGATATPTDDIDTWIKCAGLRNTDNYTTFTEVAADDELFDLLIRDSNACDYMARSTTWASTVAGSSDLMNKVNSFDYCIETLLGNIDWRTAICNSSYYTTVLNVKVPYMTSTTAPAGQVFASSNVETGDYRSSWHSFDSTDVGARNGWISTKEIPSWLGYKFTSNVTVYKVGIKNHHWAAGILDVLGNFKIQGSNNNSTWYDLGSYTNTNTSNYNEQIYIIQNPGSYLYYRVYVLSTIRVGSQSEANRAEIGKLQFYGRRSQSEVEISLVPIMTDNTHPSGEVIWDLGNSNWEVTTFPPYQAFDGNMSLAGGFNVGPDDQRHTFNDLYLGYDFGRIVSVDKFKLSGVAFRDATGSGAAIIKASNDKSTWVDVSEAFNLSNGGNNEGDIITTDKYRYWIVYITTATGYGCHFNEIQFYQVTTSTTKVHSCPNDTLYMLDDNNDPIILATTNADGIGDLDWGALKAGTWDIYSAVAKDPSNLSNDYHKSIKITKTPFGHTTDAYIIPDKALYWYGYMSSNCQDMTSTNGWSGSGTYSLAAPTHNTNSIRVTTTSTTMGGIGSKQSLAVSKIKAIVTRRGGSAAIIAYMCLSAGKSNYYTDYSEITGEVDVTRSVEFTPSGSQGYVVLTCDNGKIIDISALLYEE